jgi:hypothetical protein
VTSEPDQPDSFSKNEEANVNIFPTNSVLPPELPQARALPWGLCDHAGSPDSVPVAVRHADDEDEDEEDDLDEDQVDEDQVDEDQVDEDQVDEEELDDEEVDYEWEEVEDEDDEDDDE